MNLDASIAVFCHNEAARIRACIASLAAASRQQRVVLTVIANGCTDDSAAQALQEARSQGLRARIYTIAHGDKSNAINHSLDGLREPAAMHVFVDGYVTIGPDALTGLAGALAADPHALAATGIASNGRTMAAETTAALRDGGRLNGNLYALRPDFVDRMVGAGLGLPVGLYRGDGLLGSMVCHDLNPLGQEWDARRVRSVAAATFALRRLSPRRPADIARQFRRKIRQMRGQLENAAIRSVIYEGGYTALPRFADDMIASWLADGGRPSAGVADRAFMALALRQHAQAVRPAEASLRPVLYGTS